MDLLTKEFLKQERWEVAIETAVEKEISKTQLRMLCTPEFRATLATLIINGEYKIAPPHTAQIPKDTPGEFRTVYVNENLDRVVLSIINDMFFELYHHMIHPACKSYQKGIGCGKIVQHIVGEIAKVQNSTIGFKADLSKYFDTVPIEFIDGIFDTIGNSPIIDLVRDYYHNDTYIDEEENVCHKYQSLKQGCAVASFLADAILYDLDSKMLKLKGYYVRYSDDILYVGEDYEKAKEILVNVLKAKKLTLNPKKFEYLSKDKWFKFLGFNIKGSQITLSKNRVKTFQKEIEKRTIKAPHTRMQRAINQVNNYLYKGEYPWAASVLGVINVQHDIDTLNQFVMDCIRACATQKKKVGGLGVVMDRDDYTILRGVGKNVKANRLKTPKTIEGYMTLTCMRNDMLTCRPLFETLVRQM